MKSVIRITALFLVIMSCISLFSACGKKDEETASSVASDSGLSTADINFVNADGESTFAIVRPDGAENDFGASNVFKVIKEKFSVTPKNQTDADHDGTDRAEILIGNTNREASATALEMLKSKGTKRKDEYIICTIGDDIVINGITDDAVTAGVNYFIDNYLTGSTVTGGINYIYSDPSKYGNIEIMGTTVMSDVKIVRPIYNVAYTTQEETYKLIDLIDSKTGYVVELTHDNIASDNDDQLSASGTLTPTSPAAYEIIIGNCTRDGVKTITDYNEYEIRIEQNKIFLNGGSPYATAMAVSEFIKLVENNNVITADMSVANGDFETAFANYDNSEYYYPTWTEDFDVDDIDDLEHWTCRWDAASGYANEGKTTYRGSSTLKNNYIEDGKCYINAMQTSDAYYGGMLDTKYKFEFLYGVLELSCIHPKGIGFWTTLWTVSDSTGGPIDDPQRMYKSETDVDECYGDGNWAYGNTFAWPTSYGRQALGIPADQTGTVHVNNRVSAADDRGFYMDFHTYAFVWDNNLNVKFTCDGYVYADQDLREGPEQLVYSQPQLLMLSMACGTKNHAVTDDPVEWSTYNKYITEYVHIYQKQGNKLYYGKGDSKNTTANWTEWVYN